MNVAKQAGVHAAECRLDTVNGRKVLLVRRFDRDSAGDPIHYLSAASIMNPASLARRIGAEDGEQIFRRMLFNVLIGNTDDHGKNHGFLFDGSAWRMAPAFDITCIGGAMQSIGIGTEGRIRTVANAMSDSGRFGNTPARAWQTLREQEQSIRDFPQWLRRAGIGDGQIRTITGRTLNPGDAPGTQTGRDRRQ